MGSLHQPVKEGPKGDGPLGEFRRISATGDFYDLGFVVTKKIMRRPSLSTWTSGDYPGGHHSEDPGGALTVAIGCLKPTVVFHPDAW